MRKFKDGTLASEIKEYGNTLVNTLRLDHAAKSLLDLEINKITQQPKPSEKACLVEVHAAGINPSDVKAALGAFKHAVWPRVPGRDYAGVVVEGPSAWLGKAVWGSGGDLGITRDGSFSRYLAASTEALSEKPKNLNMIEAASVGVPFVTAYHGVIELAQLVAGQTLLVLGANGQVGSAAMELSKWVGADVIVVARNSMKPPVNGIAVNAKKDHIQAGVDAYTKGKGVDVVLNCVGKPYFKVAQACLGLKGRHVLLSSVAPEDDVSFNILDFYRKEQQFLGVNTMRVDHCRSSKILNALRPAFEENVLLPPVIDPAAVFALADAEKAFSAVMQGGVGKCVFQM